MPPQTATDVTNAPLPISPELPHKPVELPASSPEAPDISSVEADKLAIESATQEVHTVGEQVFKTLRAPAESVAAPFPTEAVVEQQEENKVLKEVEKILQEGLVEVNKKTGAMSGIFTELPEDRKAAFKETGERIAKEFADNIAHRKIEGKDIYEDVAQWLKIIPNINEPWRMQEATIKKDKLLLFADALKQDSTLNS